MNTLNCVLPHDQSVVRPNMCRTLPSVSTCVVFAKVHRSVQGYRRPDEWDSDGAVQEVSQFAGYKVNVRKKKKERKEKKKVGI